MPLKQWQPIYRGFHAQRKARKGQPPGSGYADSIESLVRNKIQKIKIDMANEVIDAGRFDMQTSMAERKETLESMLQVRASHICADESVVSTWLTWTRHQTLDQVM